MFLFEKLNLILCIDNPAPGMYDSSIAFRMLKSHGKLGLTLKPRFDLKFSKYYL